MRLQQAAVLFALLMPWRVSSQTTRIQGFVDVSAVASNRKPTNSATTIGQYDLFITSKLADKVSFVGETVFEYDNGWIVDVERVIVTFAPMKELMVAVGKHHTPIGFWNTLYHHGGLLQPTAQRPEMFRFEDEGGSTAHP